MPVREARYPATYKRRPVTEHDVTEHEVKEYPEPAQALPNDQVSTTTLRISSPSRAASWV